MQRTNWSPKWSRTGDHGPVPDGTKRHVRPIFRNTNQHLSGQNEAAVEEIEVPMSRQDIADYLGLTIETSSRILTQLEAQATIALPTSRRIILCNRRALSRLDA